MSILSGNESFTADNGQTYTTSQFDRTTGLKYGTGVWGSYIPLSEGYRAVPGAVVWAGAPFEDDDRTLTQDIPVGDGWSVTYKTWNVKRPVAYAFGYKLDPSGNPPVIRRLWVDGSLAYSLGGSQPVKYSTFNQIYLPAGQYVNGIWVPNDDTNSSGSTLGDAKPLFYDGTGPGSISFSPDGRFLGQQPLTSTISFRFYDGSETQVPDIAIKKELGDDAPSFRGLMYIVIDDVVVGQGSTSSHQFPPDTNITGGTWVGGQTVSAAFPSVRVELVDGGASTNFDDGMLMLAGSPPFAIGSSLAPNWDTGEIVTIAPYGVVHRFDTGSKAETSFATVTGALTGESVGGLTLWDTVNDWYWAPASFRSMVTVAKDGHIIDAGFIPGFDLGYDPSNGNPISDSNPTDTFPHFAVAALGYGLVNGAFETVVLGFGSSNGHGAAVHFNSNGTFPHVLYPRQIIDVPPGYAFSDVIIALPLWRPATQDQHLSYQDLCFVHTYGNTTTGLPGGARLIFVGIDSDGTTRIKGVQPLFTGATNGSSISAMMDASGNLLFQEEESGIDPVMIRRYAVDYLGAPDFTIAPGWRGLFPVVTLDTTKTYPAANSISLFGADLANVNKNDLVRSGHKLDLVTLALTPITGLTAAGLWDSSNGIIYYEGGITQASPAFSGTGVRWTQVVGGLTGDIPKLQDVLHDLSLAAGFDSGGLSIDASLSEGVPGVLITEPTDLGTLFNNMGAIYQFSYFNSGGKLTFRSATNNPTYSTGSVQTSGATSSHINVNDGDTVTIGSVTYTFRATPAAPFDVKLGVDRSVAEPVGFVYSIGNLYAAIKGDSTLGADAVPFFAGTVVNPDVTVKPDAQNAVSNYGFTKLILTATVGGLAGNSVALSTSSGGRLTLSGSTLIGGAPAPQPTINLTLDNLCLVGENQITDTDALVTSIPPPGKSQTAAAVTYYAIEQDYTRLTQTFTPDNLNGALPDSTTTVTYNLPVVMSTSEAYSRVSHTALAGSDASITQDFRLPQAYLAVEPNDVIGITIPPFQYTVRVDEATFNGDFSMSINATNFSARTDVAVSNSDSRSSVPQVVPGAGDALPLFLDAPVLTPSHGTFPGSMDFSLGVRPYYSTIKNATFSMGPTAQSPVDIFTTTEPTKWGKLAAPMPTFTYPGYVIEEVSVTVLCRSLSPTRDLQSATSEASFIAGENCMAVGRGGNWEYVFFRDVEVISPTVVRLTGLIRAQRGTDVAAANHQDSDYVVLLASASPAFVAGTRDQSMPATQHGLSYTFVALGTPASRAVVPETDIVEGYSLYPFAPTLPDAALLAGNDLGLAWVRRDRLSTTFVASPTVLSETSERYDLEILSGSAIVRTLLDLTSPAYTYTSAQQTADGFTPPLASIRFRVYQKGELGRGFAHEETVNVH